MKPLPAGQQYDFFGNMEAAWSYHWGVSTILRVASYAVNWWLFGGDDLPSSSSCFSSEADITHPAATPIIADGCTYITSPQAADLPSPDLYAPVTAELNGSGILNMRVMNISRHGNRPSAAPRNWPISSPLPGAVNVGFYDGHAQAEKLDWLWQLYWSVGYVPPANRPGLR
jgi:prepilin-type processing-associated H-X9-DG protein